jgi:hypothetical protein
MPQPPRHWRRWHRAGSRSRSGPASPARALGNTPATWSYLRDYVAAFRALLAGTTVVWQGARMRMLHPTEIIYQPTGPDIAGELEAFHAAARTP